MRWPVPEPQKPITKRPVPGAYARGCGSLTPVTHAACVFTSGASAICGWE